MKLMLAEDEPGLSRALTAILQHSDYEVDTALDGLTALEYLLTNDYDAAILDIMMPGMSGLRVCEEIRKISTVPIAHAPPVSVCPSLCSRQKARCPIRSRAWMPVPTIT